jgi:UDP-N-acetylmuramoylalanine-D-glutamate ligase
LQIRLEIKIKDKNVIVVGLARSGVGAANLLSELGADVTITDIKTEGELKDFIPRLSPLVRLVLGAHPVDIFLSSDMIVVSPGVPLSIPPIVKATARGIPIIGELELAYQVATYGSYSHPLTTGGHRGVSCCHRHKWKINNDSLTRLHNEKRWVQNNPWREYR